MVSTVLCWRDCGWGMANWWRWTDCAACANCPSYIHFPLSDNKVLLEKLTVPQPVKYFLAFYAIWMFIAAFTTAPPPVPVLCHSNPIKVLSYLLRFLFTTIFPFNNRFSKWHFWQVSPPKICTQLSLPHTCHMPRPSQSSWFYHQNNTSLRVQTLQLLITQFSSVPTSFIPLRPYIFQTTL